MQIIGSPAEIEEIDQAVKQFLNSAWSPPSTEPSTAGFRRLNMEFPDKRIIMKRAAVVINYAIKEMRDDELAYDPSADAFLTYYFESKPALRIYRSLMTAWNTRSDLGVCQNCGNLFSPKKGRIAKYCSSRCRMQSANRST